MSAGVDHVSVGVALLTVRLTDVVAVWYEVVSAGVKVTDSVWIPAFRMVPAGGL
jgi:hypothetical protein